MPIPPTLQWRGTSDLRSVVALLLQTATACWALARGTLPLSWAPVAVLAGFLLQRRIAAGPSCDLRRDLSGTVIVVTGCNTGIGYETAKALAAQRATVVLACRTERKAREAMARITRAVPGATLEFVPLDLSDFASVRTAAQTITARYGKVDVLVNNAGMFEALGTTTRLPNGHEPHVMSNVLGPVLFTELLLPALVAAKGRIVNVSSIAPWMLSSSLLSKFPADTTVTSMLRAMDRQEPPADLRRGFTGPEYYGATKIANIMYTIHLAERLRKQSVSVVALHPGSVVSDLQRRRIVQLLTKYVIGPLVLKPTAKGAQTTLHCVLSDDVVSGGFYLDCERREDAVNPFVRSPTDIEALMKWVQEVTGAVSETALPPNNRSQ